MQWRRRLALAYVETKDGYAPAIRKASSTERKAKKNLLREKSLYGQNDVVDEDSRLVALSSFFLFLKYSFLYPFRPMFMELSMPFINDLRNKTNSLS